MASKSALLVGGFPILAGDVRRPTLAEKLTELTGSDGIIAKQVWFWGSIVFTIFPYRSQ